MNQLKVAQKKESFSGEIPPRICDSQQLLLLLNTNSAAEVGVQILMFDSRNPAEKNSKNKYYNFFTQENEDKMHFLVYIFNI